MTVQTVCDSKDKDGKTCGKILETNTLVKIGNQSFDICRSCRKTTTIADLEAIASKRIVTGANA